MDIAGISASFAHTIHRWRAAGSHANAVARDGVLADDFRSSEWLTVRGSGDAFEAVCRRPARLSDAAGLDARRSAAGRGRNVKRVACQQEDDAKVDGHLRRFPVETGGSRPRPLAGRRARDRPRPSRSRPRATAGREWLAEMSAQPGQRARTSAAAREALGPARRIEHH